MMENPEELLHTLEEFSKYKPKDIPRELEDYLCFVAKTGDPVYQWPTIKNLFREKLISVITEFYEACPSVEIPPCPNVDVFHYDTMKNFILEKLDTFSAAPFTIQRICELLTTPRKEYNRIDKYMRALEKNILVVSTIEPGNKGTENGESIVNGLESEHLPENGNCSIDVNVVEMDEPQTSSKTEIPNIFDENQVVNHPQDELQVSPLFSEMNFVDNTIMNCDGIPTNTLNEMGFRENASSCQPLLNSEKNNTESSENKPLNENISSESNSKIDSEEPVVSTEMNLDVPESTEIQNPISKPEVLDEEENTKSPVSESQKSADSTSIYQPNDSVADTDSTISEKIVQVEKSLEEDNKLEEVASTECENITADSMQEEKNSEVTEQNLKATESNEVTEENNQISENEIDTTDIKVVENGYEKDEEITSSNKIPVGEVNTTQNITEANEHEAEAKEESKVMEVIYTEESTNEVTASSDELETNESEANIEPEKVHETQANEAEASPASCEAI